MAPTFRSCQNPGRTVMPFSCPPNAPDFMATGVPQPGHDAAFDDISLPHSGHLIIAIYFPLLCFDSLTFMNERHRKTNSCQHPEKNRGHWLWRRNPKLSAVFGGRPSSHRNRKRSARLIFLNRNGCFGRICFQAKCCHLGQKSRDVVPTQGDTKRAAAKLPGERGGKVNDQNCLFGFLVAIDSRCGDIRDLVEVDNNSTW